MTSKYRLLFIITSMLIIFSIGMSLLNYIVFIKNEKQQLSEQSLPLSIDNIYTEIQKNIIEPYLVASSMANNTFVHDWIKNEKRDSKKIVKYLSKVQNEYNVLNTFAVIHKTRNYYSAKGFSHKIDMDNPNSLWYKEFLLQGETHELNLDIAPNIANDLILFINYKIHDNSGSLLGVTGVALETKKINFLMHKFKKQYNLDVYFFNKQGELILTKEKKLQTLLIDEMEDFSALKEKIISKNENNVLHNYTSIDGNSHILMTKYIEELDLYMCVDADVNEFTKSVKSVFLLNIIVSLVMILVLGYILYMFIRKYSDRLEKLSIQDPLTSLSNRRDFENKFLSLYKQQKRNPKEICVLFFDLDNFKSINDNLGHQIGDRILIRFAEILQKNTRESDFLARWGGEEFVITLIDSSITSAIKIANSLLAETQDDKELQKLSTATVTCSIGLTKFTTDDTVESVIDRADSAMYQSKNNGKNQITVL